MTAPLTLTLKSPNVQFGGYFGSSVGISGETVVVGAPQESAAGNAYAGHAYIFNASTGSLMCTLTSPNAVTLGNFGESVAISGTSVLVGAPSETASGFAYAGHAYVYDATNCALTATLTSPNAQAGGEFGGSVSLSGGSAAVGASRETAAGFSGAGRAYVLSASTGALISTLTSPSAQTDGYFGTSVSISSPKAVVGAPGESSAGYSGAGNAYVFAASSGAWKATLVSPNAQSGGAFGTSVGINGTKLVVGATGETVSGFTGAGHAYLFKTSGGAPTATLASSNEQTYGNFGTSIAIGTTTIVVGASSETVSGDTYAGHAYIFSSSNGASISTLTSPNVQGTGYFGWSVATNGSAFAVGAAYESAGGTGYAGHAYVFPAATDVLEFGFSVAVSGSLAVVGAPDETVGGYSFAGNAYVFNATTGALLTTLANPGPQTGGLFGSSVAISGLTAVVGTRYYTVSGTTYAGRAYLFNASTGALLSTLSSPHPQKDGHFGWSVAISGTTVVVGAPFEKSKGVSLAGRAYVFDATTSALISTLNSPAPQTYGEFGWSVAVSGSLVVVGAPDETSAGLADAGYAHVYRASSGALIASPTSPNPVAGGGFGDSVAIDGTTAVIGAPYETSASLSEAGNAYVFTAKTAVVISTLKSPSAVAMGEFGYSVDLSGSTAVIGAPGETASGYVEAGNGYLFSTSGTLSSTISSLHNQTYGSFGESVAISGTTEVAGAPGEMASGYVEAGNAYLFT